MPLLIIFLISLVSFTANAQVVIEPMSVLLRSRGTIVAHTSAIYLNEQTGLRERNRMFPRIMRRAIEKNPQVAVRVADQKAIDWFKKATPILEYLPPQLMDSAEVTWVTREEPNALPETELEYTYWILPFGNPLKRIDKASLNDVQFSYETIVNSIERYMTLHREGHHASIVLDMIDGGDTVDLAYWVLNNINARVIDSGFKPLDVQIVKLHNSIARMYPQPDVMIETVTMPLSLEQKYPLMAEKFKELIKTYSNACTQALK